MKGRAKLLIPLGVVILGLVAWRVFLEEGTDSSVIEASGTVEATEADLGFQVAGRVARISTREGDEVQSGQELAVLDTTRLASMRASAAAQLAATEARLRELLAGSRPEEVRSAEAALEGAVERESEARRETERARRLLDGGAISEQAWERSETLLRLTAAERRRAEEALALARVGARDETIDAQRALVEQARAGLAHAEAALQDAVVTAPFSGVVTVRHRQPGETVAPGAPVLTLLDRDDRWVRIYIAEDRIGRVRLGQQATMRSDSYPDRAYRGEVFFIGSEAEFTPRNVQTSEERTRLVYPVKVRVLDDGDFELKPGTPADVRLEGAGS